MSRDPANPCGDSSAPVIDTADAGMQRSRTVTLRRVDVVSVGKISGVLDALAGVIDNVAASIVGGVSFDLEV
ncbi:MAG: hypothetical protein AAGC97_04950 [Planctomycetota bacterium]